jgi:hypothetical protein
MLNVCFYIKLLCNCGCLMCDDNSYISFHSTHLESTTSYKVYFVHCFTQAEKNAHHNNFISCAYTEEINAEFCLLLSF